MLRRLLCRPSTSNCRYTTTSNAKDDARADVLPPSMRVFDRQMKMNQRNWAAQQPDFNAVQYLKEEVGWRIADRVSLLDFIKWTNF